MMNAPVSSRPKAANGRVTGLSGAGPFAPGNAPEEFDPLEEFSPLIELKFNPLEAVTGFDGFKLAIVPAEKRKNKEEKRTRCRLYNSAGNFRNGRPAYLGLRNWCFETHIVTLACFRFMLSR
jgi:hypothetical protein